MGQAPFVPVDFDVPRGMWAARFRLEPLGPQHNAADLAAWMSSISHIQSTPGFAEHDWPPDDGFPAEANLADLVRHDREFEQRAAFAYLDPGPRPGAVDVRSWVRADVADLDGFLRRAVRDWLEQDWPFDETVYAG